MNTPRNLSARNLRLAFLPALVLAFPALPDHAGLRVRGSITPLIAIPRPGPVIPPEIAPAYLDNLSDQTVYGMKTFIQPVQGDLIGTAAEAILFTGPLSGDVQGTQSATRVTRVSLDALPSIGFGPTFAAAKVKYVNTDADPADPRMDGSIAHPYYSLATAANGAHDGDHFFLTGSFYGAFVFSRAVTVQGSSPDQTTVYGTMVFSGFLASHLRDVRVNCTADAACVSNRSTRGSDLVMHRVTINQSGAGPAAESDRPPDRGACRYQSFRQRPGGFTRGARFRRQPV